MKYTTKENESFDAEILRQELVAAIGPDYWYINTAGNTVEFCPTADVFADPTATILAHFANGTTRDANKALLTQIAELESTVTDRRIREAVLGQDASWLAALNQKCADLRKTLQK